MSAEEVESLIWHVAFAIIVVMFFAWIFFK